MQQSFISTNDLALNRGYAVFDFFRVFKGIPLFIDDYLNRFYNSAYVLGLSIPYTKDELKATIKELIFINNLEESGIRLVLTGGISENNFAVAEPNLIITPSLLQLPSQIDFDKGIHLITHDYLRTLPHVKSTNYLMAIWLQDIIKKAQADDVIYTNNSNVLELPRANIFIITNENVLVTPHQNILAGVTRKNIIAIAESLLKVEERNITIDELLNAQEVFISSTTKRILPVAAINNCEVNSNFSTLISKELYKKLLQKEVDYCSQYSI